MRLKIKWLWRGVTCFVKGHKDIVALYNPVTGDRDMGFVCARCGRPRLQNAKWLM